MSKRLRKYIIVAIDKSGNYHTDYIQASTAQQAVDILYSELRDEYEILDVAVVVKNYK